MRLSRRATAPPGRAERWIVSVVMSGFATLRDAAAAWADHPGGLRTERWSPLTAALLLGGLALLAGMLVIVIVTLLTRRDDRSP